MSLSALDAGREAPTRDALVDADVPLSWREVADRVSAQQAAWRPHLDPRRGDRVLLEPAPTVESAVRVYAALELGVALVLAHPRWADGEWDAVTLATQPRLVLRGGRERWLRPPRQRGPQPAVVVYSSGTTGAPKGIALSSSALEAACEAHTAALGWNDDDRWLLAMPPAHIGGLSILLRCLHARRATVLAPGPFDARALGRTLATHRVTLLSLVPAMLRRLLDADVRPAPCLRAVLLGGAATPDRLLAEGRAAGWPVLTTYGLSEASAQVCTQRLGAERDSGVGRALPGLSVRVRDGAIEVGGPTLFDGYFPPEAGIRAPMTGDGWLRTGDLGRLDDDGHLHVLGRADDRIVTGGENVDPLEVEIALEAMPEVREAMVIGTADETYGERVTAWIVADGEPTLKELRAGLANRLAAYKHPREMRLVEELPRTASGKKDRGAARQPAGPAPQRESARRIIGSWSDPG